MISKIKKYWYFPVGIPAVDTSNSRSDSSRDLFQAFHVYSKYKSTSSIEWYTSICDSSKYHSIGLVELSLEYTCNAWNRCLDESPLELLESAARILIGEYQNF
jgi:hypothetical protein